VLAAGPAHLHVATRATARRGRPNSTGIEFAEIGPRIRIAVVIFLDAARETFSPDWRIAGLAADVVPAARLRRDGRV
jgi:hypothetical protein